MEFKQKPPKKVALENALGRLDNAESPERSRKIRIIIQQENEYIHIPDLRPKVEV